MAGAPHAYTLGFEKKLDKRRFRVKQSRSMIAQIEITDVSYPSLIGMKINDHDLRQLNEERLQALLGKGFCCAIAIDQPSSR